MLCLTVYILHILRWAASAWPSMLSLLWPSSPTTRPVWTAGALEVGRMADVRGHSPPLLEWPSIVCLDVIYYIARACQGHVVKISRNRNLSLLAELMVNVPLWEEYGRMAFMSTFYILWIVIYSDFNNSSTPYHSTQMSQTDHMAIIQWWIMVAGQVYSEPTGHSLWHQGFQNLSSWDYQVPGWVQWEFLGKRTVAVGNIFCFWLLKVRPCHDSVIECDWLSRSILSPSLHELITSYYI